MSTLLDIPLWEIADLTQPPGLGDKKILREVIPALLRHYGGVRVITMEPESSSLLALPKDYASVCFCSD